MANERRKQSYPEICQPGGDVGPDFLRFVMDQ